MTDSYDELLTIVAELQQLAAVGRSDEIWQPLERLKTAAEDAHEAWSGSPLGYHANVYYGDIRTPPPGEHFSTEWGLARTAFVPDATTGGWAEHDPDQVTRAIYERAGNPDMGPVVKFNEGAKVAFARQKSNLLSIIDIEAGNSKSQFLNEQKEETSKLSIISENKYLEEWMPGRAIISRDYIAMGQGRRVPPHLRVLAQVTSMQTTITSIQYLALIADQMASHTSRWQRQSPRNSSLGNRVFIGHGHSQTWRELKDFLEDRLGLLVDEFNRVPPAGMPTSGRLSAMLDTAAIAFLVMTGEDEQSDGELRARENVVHEAGLFQGRLGFERAIVLLEEGCEKFSNIDGLGHIPFPKGNISAAFEEIRKILEREGVLKVQVP